MLSSKNRINKGDFDRIFEKGKLFSSPVFTLKIIHEEALKNPQCAVVVSKKIETKAVRRNYMRRIVYTILSPYIQKQSLKPAFYIFMVRKPALSMTFKELEKEIDFILKKATI